MPFVRIRRLQAGVESGTIPPMYSSVHAIAADTTPTVDYSRSIILVEDEPDIRANLADYLTRVGFDVTAVDNGLKFYHALAERPFAVAVIDLGLPDMDGMQLVEYLRNNSAMRCIILTARTSVDDRVSGYESGADLYLCKPVEGRELAAALNRIMQRNSLNQAYSANQWRLRRHQSALLTSSLSVISLTAKEIDFVCCLAAAAGETVPRTVLLETLGYQNDDFSNRALESLIRRLRRKIEAACGSSPILTRHAVGYSFAAPLVVE